MRWASLRSAQPNHKPINPKADSHCNIFLHPNLLGARNLDCALGIASLNPTYITTIVIKSLDWMMRYRRAKTPGGTYFFTVNLADRTRALLVDHIDLLRTSVAKVKDAHPFVIIAWVVLPEHMHAIWKLPDNDCDFSMRWSLIKSGFSRQINKTELIGMSRMSKGERGIWQRRFWEHEIRDEQDLLAHINYIHNNPVKHGYAKSAADWPYTSFNRHR
jgi:putative transposase